MHLLNHARLRSYTCVPFILLILVGCAQPFIRPSEQTVQKVDHEAQALFQKVFEAHGGNNIASLNDVNVSIDGKWKFLITRIQPLVTDHKYRVRSEERLLPNEGVYAAAYSGPAGTKKVYRTPQAMQVFYGDEKSLDRDALEASALTSDAFFIFLLGPLGMQACEDNFRLLEDTVENSQTYHRLYCEKQPGIGYSEKDELVLWVDSETLRAYRIEMTLEGYKTTRGAHVDVTFLDFVDRGGFLFPSEFKERVLAPIKIHAHSWWLTGIDINRGLTHKDLSGASYSSSANRPAEAVEYDQ